MSRKPAMFLSTRPVASPVDWVISVMALTNSDTRSMRVFSRAPMFSWAPLSTSCNMMLASRSRSNRAVVSERSTVCVSSISLTLEVAVSLERAIVSCVTSLSSVIVRLTALVAASPAVLIMREISVLLSIIVREMICFLGNCRKHAAALIGQYSGHLVGAPADGGRDLLGFADEVARNFLADADERAFCIARACADGFGGRQSKLTERAFRLRRIELDGLAQLLQPRVERVGCGLAARFDLARDHFGAADQKLFETADTVVEIAGDLKGAVTQGLVHLADLDADSVRNFDPARIDGAGHLADALIKRADHFLAAFGQSLRELGNARSEKRFKLRDSLVERVGNVPGSPRHALVESVEVVAKSLGHILGPLTEPPDQFAAIVLYGVIEFGDLPSDKVAEGDGVS